MPIEMSLERPTGSASTSAEMSDSNWLKSLKWEKTTASELKSAGRAGEVSLFGKNLKKSLQPLISSRTKGKNEWEPLPVPSLSALGAKFTDLIADGEAEVLSELLEGSAITVAEWRDFAWLFTQNVKQLSDSQTAVCWRLLYQSGQELSEQFDYANLDAGLLDIDQLEMQFLFGVLFSVIKGEKSHLKSATKALRQAIEDSTDNDGTPHADLLPTFVAILESLTRTSLIARANKTDLWKDSQRQRIGEMLDRSVSLLTKGAYLGCSHDRDRFQQTASALIRSVKLRDETLSRQLIDPSTKFTKSELKTWKTPDECHQSDWAEWGSLRSNWGSPSDVCNVLYNDRRLLIDTVASNRPLLHGIWNSEIRVDGSLVELTDDCSCVCWFEDEQSVLMEIAQEGPSGIQLIRQAILLREENLLVLADSIRTQATESLEYTKSLPIAPRWEVAVDGATREVRLTERKSRVRYIPLSAPLDRSTISQEQLRYDNQVLRTTCKSEGSNLYSVSLFDWSRKRRESVVDWARVTVAEDGQSTPVQDAVAYRLRIGNRRWLLYHSLVEPDIPRTAMGLHTASETVFAELKNNGEFHILVEVEL